jgi:Rps23 Pro-64 3,4-dihydroxylase Tpa1-like proline 4-hydroxylase
VPAFEPALSEAHGLLYADGDFFRTHRDTGPNNTRRVTFVYTLFRSPRRFGGGDLLLYDTFFWPGVSESPAWVPAYADTFTRLAPEDNRLVFFPSEFYHEVTPVTGVGDDASWGRVAINGWLDTTPELGALAHLSRTPY